MTVQSVQQIRRRPEWNPENKTAKATQPNLASRSSYTSKHGRFRTACNWRLGPVLTPWPSTRPDCNWYVSVVFTLPALLQPWWVHKQVLLLLLLLLCLPTAANFYIVRGVPGCIDCSCCLKCMHVLVETSIYVACFPRGISTYVLLFLFCSCSDVGEERGLFSEGWEEWCSVVK